MQTTSPSGDSSHTACAFLPVSQVDSGHSCVLLWSLVRIAPFSLHSANCIQYTSGPLNANLCFLNPRPLCCPGLHSTQRTFSRQKAEGGWPPALPPFCWSQLCCCGKPAHRGVQSQVGSSFTRVREEEERRWRRKGKEGKRRKGEGRGGKEEKEVGERADRKSLGQGNP